jgi:hypothetical protein
MGFWGMLYLLMFHQDQYTNSYFSDNNEDSYKQVYENDNFDENKSSFGHELVAGGAAFAGFKAFEDHQRSEGSSSTHLIAINRTG